MQSNHRCRILAFVGIALLSSLDAGAEALYRSEVKDRQYGGKPLVMEVQEQSRDKRTSTVKVTFHSGASMPSALYIAKCISEIGKARDAKYFVILKEWESDDGAQMYRVGFVQEPVADAAAYFGEPVVASGQNLPQYLSIEDLDKLLNPTR